MDLSDLCLELELANNALKDATKLLSNNYTTDNYENYRVALYNRNLYQSLVNSY